MRLRLITLPSRVAVQQPASAACDEMDSPCHRTGIIVPPELFGMEESTT